MLSLQPLEQGEQSPFLCTRARIRRHALRIQPTLITHTDGVLVIPFGMCSHELFVTCLIDGAVAGDVIVIARESEALRVTADERCHGKALVAACGTAVNNNQINLSHNTLIKILHSSQATAAALHTQGARNGSNDSGNNLNNLFPGRC